MRRRHPQLSLLARLLALLVLAGAVLPSPQLWQCRHAARTVSAAFSAPASAMPCRMAGMTSGVMACCLAAHVARPSPASPRSVLRPLGCRPTRVALSSPPAAFFRVGLSSQRFWTALAHPGLPPTFTAFSLSATRPVRQRPPPSDGLFRCDALFRPRLRAPPAA